jgi:3-deoxy-7-phosphoheptulonate synthase
MNQKMSELQPNAIVKISSSAKIEFGGKEIPIIAGPCSIESEEQLFKIGRSVKSIGASILRGGIYKMRTNPNSFQGLGEKAYTFINQVKSQIEMPLISEIVDPRQISDMMSSVDIFQVGSRNMYNYSLLKELAKTNKPVMLKRGFSATIEEWINAANYLIQGGNPNVILCERGIRTFETATRNTLDLNAVAYIKAHTPFAVVVDPSHGTGRPELIAAMSAAAIAAGADGIMVEVHHDPAKALSDAFQALNFDQFAEVVSKCRSVAHAMNRTLLSDIK